MGTIGTLVVSLVAVLGCESEIGAVIDISESFAILSRIAVISCTAGFDAMLELCKCNK